MNLFELKNNKLVIAPEALALHFFKTIWERDKSKDKEKAITELSLVYFMCDYRSEFQNILDEKDRYNHVKSILNLPKDYVPDEVVGQSFELYKSMQETPSIKLINDAKIGLASIQRFFRTVDLSAVDKSGKPKYSAKQVADTLATLPKLIQSINVLEEQIKKEVEQKNNTLRGGRTKGSFAD